MSIINSGGVDEHCPAFNKSIKLKGPGAEAFVVIDSFLGGGGTGGVRFGESVTLEEVAGLAREMSLKFAWLNIARGGAKSGIAYKGNLSEVAKERMLREFGESISDLLQSQKYIAGMDLGVGPVELELIMSSAGMPPETKQLDADIDSNYFTALTVFVSLLTLLQQNGENLQGIKVLVEGVGKVSSILMRMIVATGASVVGVSTMVGSIYDQNGIDIDELLNLKDKHGDDCVKSFRSLAIQAPEELFFNNADVLIPGARAHSINETNVNEIQARFVVPIANISTSSPMEKVLFDRGINYIPGFVSNSGGIFCWYLARLSDQAREGIIRRGYASKVSRLLVDADRMHLPIAELARLQAKNNANRMELEGRSFFHRVVGLVRKLSPRRSIYIALSKGLGRDWSSKDSLFCRSYFNARYFR